jgi:hypothetical protein
VCDVDGAVVLAHCGEIVSSYYRKFTERNLHTALTGFIEVSKVSC